MFNNKARNLIWIAGAATLTATVALMTKPELLAIPRSFKADGDGGAPNDASKKKAAVAVTATASTKMDCASHHHNVSGRRTHEQKWTRRMSSRKKN